MTTKSAKPVDIHKHHGELVEGFSDQLEGILKSSGQAVYLYLDDTHKACNKKFASLLGYKSPEEWAKRDVNFVDTFLAKESRDTVVSTYHEKVMEKLSGAVIPVVWKKKGGGTVRTTVIVVPQIFNGHYFALGFVSKDSKG